MYKVFLLPDTQAVKQELFFYIIWTGSTKGKMGVRRKAGALYFSLKHRPPVEDPERFYRSGVKSWPENPNLEYRNSKQRNSNSNFQMTETRIP